MVAADGWEEAVQALTTRPAAVAVSRLRRNQTRLATELLAAEFEVAEQLPQGGDLPPGKHSLGGPR